MAELSRARRRIASSCGVRLPPRATNQRGLQAGLPSSPADLTPERFQFALSTYADFLTLWRP